jgi:hypothetical protein
MKEIYLSFAAFLFYIKNTGVVYEAHNNDYLSLHYGMSKFYLCPIMPGKRNYDCGYIVLNVGDFQKLFGKTAEIVNLNNNKIVNLYDCERPKQRNIDGNIEHCKLPEELWENIPTEISEGIVINCKRKKK